MPSWIDEFVFVRSGIFVRGWSSEAEIGLVVDRQTQVGTVEREERADLIPDFGEAAKQWGFTARACVNIDEPHRRISLRVGTQFITADGHTASYNKASDGLLNQFVAEIRAARGSVLEIGARARSGNTRRDWFEGCQYIGADIIDGPNVDVIADAHFLSRTALGPFDGVLSISTFEHLIMPWIAATEINRVLRVGGLVFTHSHQTWPLHDAPWDFFRFSKFAWHSLFNEISGFEVIGAEHGEPAVVTPLLQLETNDATRLDRESGYLRSVCLARKIGEPKINYSIAPETYARIVGGGFYPT